ncbi:MAG: alcohol dehydrogenase catalytic domain-containing protein, partial [Planctomycetota bacterium]
MRAACFEEVQIVRVRQIDDPTILRPGDAIVDVELAGLCGSDLHPFFGREVGMDPGTVMGHEFVGTVVEVGDDVREVQVGDRVCSAFTTNCGTCFYCDRGLTSRCPHGQLFGWRANQSGLHGGQSERVRVPLADGTLMRIGKDFDANTALLMGDNLSTALFGVDMATDPRRIDEDVLLVVGCGTVGLLAIQCAIAKGAQRVFAVDPNLPRLEMAVQLGAIGSECSNPI